MSNYQVVLFKNKTKKKIINKFITYNRAKQLFDKLVEESNQIVFETKFENGKPCVYDLAILGKSGDKFTPIFVTDELGRNIKVDMDEFQRRPLDLSSDWEMFEPTSQHKAKIKSLVSGTNRYLGKKTTAIKLQSRRNSSTGVF